MRSPLESAQRTQEIMQIISVPTVFTCKTPSAGWLNLARIRQLQFEEFPNPIVTVTWDNGNIQNFFGENAAAIMQTWLEADTNHRFKNRYDQT